MNFILRTLLTLGLATACLPSFADNWVKICAKDNCSATSNGFDPQKLRAFANTHGLIIDESRTRLSTRPVDGYSIPSGTSEFYMGGGRLAHKVFTFHVVDWSQRSQRSDFKVASQQKAEEFCNELILLGRYKGEHRGPIPYTDKSLLFTPGIPESAIAVAYPHPGYADGSKTKYWYCPNPHGYEGNVNENTNGSGG